MGTRDTFTVTVTATKLPGEIRPQPNGLKKPEPATDGGPNFPAHPDRTPKEQQMLNESLHDASKLGEISRIRYLIRSGANVDVRDGDGMTPLMKAARAGQGEAVRLLALNGADLSAKDWSFSGNPLIFAVQSCDLETVRALVELGAAVNVGVSGWTPLNTAKFLEFSRKGHFGIVEFLERRGAR